MMVIKYVPKWHHQHDKYMRSSEVYVWPAVRTIPCIYLKYDGFVFSVTKPCMVCL